MLRQIVDHLVKIEAEWELVEEMAEDV